MIAAASTDPSPPESCCSEALTALKLQWSNPYIVNLNDNIQRYHLDVATIIPLHGPRTGTLAELQELAKLPVMPKS